MEEKRCGIVSIVGRPNVGKSTLLNCLLGEKVSIVSKVPQTTRFQVRGIYNDGRGQIIFIDTPGLHLGKDKLDAFMNKSSLETLPGADCIIYLVDTSRKIGLEEENIVQKLKLVRRPVILGLNKVDLKARYIPEYLALWEKARGKKINEMKNFTLVAISGKDGINTDKLLEIVFDYLPAGPLLYPSDTISDTPRKMVIADIIREKFLSIVREEVPHSLAVQIEEIRPGGRKILYLKAVVLVQRDTQKEIVIGKGGENLKRTGTSARAELEKLLEQKIYLELFVKAKKDWRDNPSLLEDLGYDPKSI